MTSKRRKAELQPAVSPLLLIRDWLAPRQSEMVADLKELVLMESPTHDKAACDALSTVLAAKFKELGGRREAASPEESWRSSAG